MWQQCLETETSEWGDKGGPWSDGTDVLVRRDTRALSSLRPHREGSHLPVRGGPSPGTESAGPLTLDCLSEQLRAISFSCFGHPACVRWCDRSGCHDARQDCKGRLLPLSLQTAPLGAAWNLGLRGRPAARGDASALWAVKRVAEEAGAGRSLRPGHSILGTLAGSSLRFTAEKAAS